MNAMGKLLQLGGALANPLGKILAKWKVFQQILIIIGVMITFLVVEGVLGLWTMNQMQQITKLIFYDSVQGFRSISSLRVELNTIQRSYSRSFLDKQIFYGSFITVESTIQSDFNNAEGHQIQTLVNQLKVIVTKPPTPQTLEEFDHAIALIELNLSNLENKLTSNALKSMETGNRFFSSSQNLTLLILGISLITSLILGIGIAALISKPLKQMIISAKALAAGDLTQDLKAKGCHEVNELVKGFNEAIASLRKLVTHIEEKAQGLTIASMELKDASTSSGKAAAEVAVVIEELAKSSMEQAGQVHFTSNTVAELSQLVTVVSHDTAQMASASKKIAAAADVGQNITHNVANEIGELYKSTRQIGSVILEMSKASEEINEVASMIGNIAEQTTLLALNASIEAARAGEHGKGFSVVAEETGKLAEESKKAAQRIAKLVDQMINRSEQAGKVLHVGMIRVEAGKSLITKASVTFEDIFKELESIIAEIYKVAESAQQMAQRNELMTGAMAQVAIVSEAAVANTEEVSATVEEQSAGAEQVTALAENLAVTATQMKQSIAAFVI